MGEAMVLRAGREIGRGKSRWFVKRTIAAGAFGQVYEVGSLGMAEEMVGAMKVEPMESAEESLLVLEAKVARLFSGQNHGPRFLGSGSDKSEAGEPFLWMAMELLGPSLAELRKRVGTCFSASTGLRLLLQGVEAMSQFHAATGFIHRDLKPANLAMGLSGGRKKILVLFDFGLARRLLNGNGTVRRARSDCAFRGSLRYASAKAHEGKEQGRGDDLWSLFYVFIDLMRAGNLSWVGEHGMALVGRLKASATPVQLCAGLPFPLQNFPIHLRSLGFHSAPDYALLQSSVRLSLDTLHDPSPLFDWERPNSPSRMIPASARSVSPSSPQQN